MKALSGYCGGTDDSIFQSLIKKVAASINIVTFYVRTSTEQVATDSEVISVGQDETLKTIESIKYH